MIFLNFNMLICILDLILYCLCVLRAMHLLKTRHPGVKWVRMSHWSDTIMAILKTIIASICPVLNIVILFNTMMRDKEIIENAVEETYRAQMEFQQKNKEQNV